MRVLAAAATVAGALLAAGAASPAPLRTVPCDEIILTARSGIDGGYRVVLGRVSVPPPYLRQVVRTAQNPRYPYWRKAGLVIRGGSPPVTVTVPRAWRSRAAITWGNNTPVVSALRLASCPAVTGRPWNVYAGGFYLRGRAACVPLQFRVGVRMQTVRFGVGRRCG